VREHGVQHRTDGLGDTSEGKGAIIAARETTTDIKEVHVVAEILSPLEDLLGAFKRLGESGSVALTRTDVEGDTNNVQSKVLRGGKKLTHVVERSTELGAQAADGVAVIGDDAKNELGVRMNLLNLVKLELVIEGHVVDAVFSSEGNHTLCLAAVGVDDIGRLSVGKREDHLNFASGGAIKLDAEGMEGGKNHGVGVTLHRIEGLYARKVILPQFELSNEVAKVDNEESILLSLIDDVLNDVEVGAVVTANAVLMFDVCGYAH
jgi:hypothetical protein